MNLSRIISKRIRGKGLAADVNAVVSANVGGGSRSTHVSSRQRVVQRSGRTVDEQGGNDGRERAEP
jgi:hypothetical protein